MKSDNGKKKVDIVGLNEIIDLSNRILKITYFFLFIIVIYALTALLKEWHIFTFLFLLLKVLSPLFIGLIIAWFLEPFVTFLSDRGVYRFLGVILVYLILITFLYIIMVTAFPLLLKQSNEVLTIFPILIEKLNLWLNNFFRGFEKISFLDLELIRTDTLEYFSLIIKSLTTDIPEIIFNSLKAVLSTVGVVLFGLIIGFYLLFDFNNIGKRILTIMPKRIRNDLKYLYAEINISLLSYIKGTIFISVILFFLTAITLHILNIRVSILLAFILAITDIIPYIGSYIGAIPIILIAFTEGVSAGILTMIVLLVIQLIKSNFIQPLVMSRTMKLHPVSVIVSILFFGYFFGIIGMIVATPIIAISKMLLLFLNKKYNIIKV